MWQIHVVTIIAIIGHCQGDINPSDYVKWKMADIQAWHQYFPSRSLQEEASTNSAARQATQAVSSGLISTLEVLLKYQYVELQTALLMMQGTYAQGCIQGIASDLSDAVQSAVTDYNDCAADADSALQRLNASLTKTINNYLTVYQNTLNGISNCARIYPNKDSISRLKNCVDAWNNNYFTVANKTMIGVLASQSMAVFNKIVVPCAEAAGQQVVNRGQQFLTNLIKCSRLSENVDWQSYESEVTAGYMTSYTTTFNLSVQVSQTQGINSQAVATLEQEMLDYYALQKDALEQYVIESRNQGYYWSQLRSILYKYFNTVSLTSSDNPASPACTSNAYNTLNTAISTESNEVLRCDQEIVNNTVTLLEQVNNDFQLINSVLPTAGNYLILSCFSQGYIFMENAIVKCFNIEWSRITVDNIAPLKTNITKDVAILLNYRDTFFGNSSLPCSDTVLPKSYLWAEKSLYDLERCLYMDSGATYEVTTPLALVG